MPSPYPRATVHFNRDFVNGESGLFNWFKKAAAQNGNASKFVYDALAITRLFGSLEQAQAAAECLREVQRLSNGDWREWLAKQKEFNDGD